MYAAAVAVIVGGSNFVAVVGGDGVVVGDNVVALVGVGDNDVYANTLILCAMTSLHNGQSLRSSCDEQLLHRHRCRHGSSTTLLSAS